ncbi:MAG: TIGR00295 family protein [Nitrospirae bacterium]|nr:MAG: TIGR00295 family protein [Nitrospirota bacterium]
MCEILTRVGCDTHVQEHILAVRKLALEIADSLKVPVDRDLVEKGAVYHDIGRAKTHGIQHAVLGAEMAKEMGLDDRVVRIVERHIGAGISKEEAKELGLPEKDYIPETLEEKIVAYADNLINGSKVVSFEEALERFKKVLGPEHPAIERFIKMHREIESLKT